MDINTVRGLATLFALIAFVLMLLWVYSSKRKEAYDEAASLPFADEFSGPKANDKNSLNSLELVERGGKESC